MKSNLLFGIILLFSVLLIIGCTQPSSSYLTPSSELQQKLASVNLPVQYTVGCHHKFSSSGGDRRWNLVYDIADENFVSCSGKYHFSGSDGEKEVECTLNMLQKDGVHIFYTMGDLVEAVNTGFTTEVFESKLSDRDCYYVQNGNGNVNGLVCFNAENEIVTYFAKGGYGGAETTWLLDGYEWTSEIEGLRG